MCTGIDEWTGGYHFWAWRRLQKKYGMSVPEHPANRIFYVRNEQKNKLYKLIEHVDIEYIFVAE
ncbi:hypothetical protein EsCd1HHP049_03428 [Escherichia sp. HH154_1D]|nr:CAT RNA binding domain-containing protein [Escherichia coli M863]BDI37703.1 hypothetical protein EsCdI10290_03634 [Escherichia sp. 10290]BDI47464.1 hypothetical protein EsCd1HHP049_03428 [Escherichia sp. HH154_1D]